MSDIINQMLDIMNDESDVRYNKSESLHVIKVGGNYSNFDVKYGWMFAGTYVHTLIEVSPLLTLQLLVSLIVVTKPQKTLLDLDQGLEGHVLK